MEVNKAPSVRDSRSRRKPLHVCDGKMFMNQHLSVSANGLNPCALHSIVCNHSKGSSLLYGYAPRCAYLRRLCPSSWASYDLLIDMSYGVQVSLGLEAETMRSHPDNVRSQRMH